MAIFSKNSLESVRQRVDLAEFLSSYMELKRNGSTYKGLCPFHDEKTPSFTIRKGDTHYHCFGCGAHGDAIAFLMNHQKINFTDAVQLLAERFKITLETLDEHEEPRGPNKSNLKNALEQANQFFQFSLLHTAEGHCALKYLYARGIDLAFIHHFQIGLAPSKYGLLQKFMQHNGIEYEALVAAGLLHERADGSLKDFFVNRIMFPIHNASGNVIGFSARKYLESTTGGKYVNSPETILFKKSQVLFGLNYSRKRIISEKRVIIVEGQIDALRLIQEGFNCTIAGQGTAFGDGHVQQLLQMGVQQVFLALDSDKAGQEAVYKIGNLCQKDGMEVFVIMLPAGEDPDSFLRAYGPHSFLRLVQESIDYLSFLVKYLAKNKPLDSPAVKNALVQEIAKLVRSWNYPVMVHETLRKLAHLLQVPEEYMNIGREPISPNVYIKKQDLAVAASVDSDRIIESDLLRWMLFIWQENRSDLMKIVRLNLKEDDIHSTICRDFFKYYFENIENNLSCDLNTLLNRLGEVEADLLRSELLKKKINVEKASAQLVETVQKILYRNWMEKKEQIKVMLHQPNCSENEAVVLIKQFDSLQRNAPCVKLDAEHG